MHFKKLLLSIAPVTGFLTSDLLITETVVLTIPTSPSNSTQSPYPDSSVATNGSTLPSNSISSSTNPTLTNPSHPTSTIDSSTTVINSTITVEPLPFKASAAVLLASSPPVFVGNLTGTALYTSISNVLEVLCPTATSPSNKMSCITDPIEIQNIIVVESEFKTTLGELHVQVVLSEYNQTSLREALIKSIALAVNTSATAASGNCVERLYAGSTALTTDHAEQCWAAQAVEAAYFISPQSNSAGNITTDFDFIHCNFEFKSVPLPTAPISAFSCNFTQNLTDALVVLEPDFTLGDVELGGGINASCTSAINDGFQTMNASSMATQPTITTTPIPAQNTTNASSTATQPTITTTPIPAQNTTNASPTIATTPNPIPAQNTPNANSTTTSIPSTITTAPNPTPTENCYLHFQYFTSGPVAGTFYCSCSGGQSLPVLPVPLTASVEESCAYASFPVVTTDSVTVTATATVDGPAFPPGETPV